MTQPEIVVPSGAPLDDRTAFATKDGITYVQSWLVGYAPENGERVFKREFRLVLKGESEMSGVVAEESALAAQIEDMAAWVSERTATKIMERIQRRGSRLTLEQLAARENWDARRELAASWRDYRKWARRRRSGAGRSIYLPASLVSK